jgi:hypothetical protein
MRKTPPTRTTRRNRWCPLNDRARRDARTLLRRRPLWDESHSLLENLGLLLGMLYRRELTLERASTGRSSSREVTLTFRRPSQRAGSPFPYRLTDKALKMALGVK